MPTYTTTLKHALRRLAGSNVISDIDAGFTALADDVDAKLTPYSAGLLSARPTSTAGSPGITGRQYYATDFGLLFVDYGTGWAPIGIPIGGGFDWFGTGDPSVELMVCDGRAISRTTYATLFAKLSTAYGAGNGSTTFNLPSTADRTLVGVSGTIARGATGGAKTHTLTINEIPSHAHQVARGPNLDGGTTFLGPQAGFSDFQSSEFTGGGGAHENMPPYLGAYKVIRVL